MNLQPQPTPPPGVQYALTVPQSVLFADLSLRGSTRPAFEEVFSMDYEPSYIAIDNGAMSWNYTTDEAFTSALVGERSVRDAVARFITAMGITSRAVRRTTTLLEHPANRRDGNREDLLADLRAYWRPYELQMTNLFTFWNVEHLLSTTLTEGLRAAGREDDIAAGLERFLQPNETNYFALQRKHLGRLAERFLPSDGSVPATDAVPAELRAALELHVDLFGFLLAPFNLGAPPSWESMLGALGEAEKAAVRGELVEVRGASLEDLPVELRELGYLAQQFTFWKTERLDVMSLTDSRVADLYKAAADALGMTTDQMFAMTRAEIEQSLETGEPVVDDSILTERLDGFCLILHNGSIDFYEPGAAGAAAPTEGPAAAGTELQGIAASAGTVSGRVAIIRDLSDIEKLAPGDILVTTMTRPEMGAALDRAAAFVTDEGGLMSHAAIISREMKKPCVIGTETATALLRDGMVVEVDGGAGRVTVTESV